MKLRPGMKVKIVDDRDNLCINGWALYVGTKVTLVEEVFPFPTRGSFWAVKENGWRWPKRYLQPISRDPFFELW